MLTPLHYQHGYQYPLLVWLHSAGHNERQIEQVLPHISTRNYVGLGVRATRATDVRGCGFDWPCGRDATAKACEVVLDAIDQVAEEYSINSDRVVLAGYGSGATLACQIALLHSDRFAGVVRMGGRFPDASGVFKNFKRLRERRMPMLWQQAINGVDDDPELMQRDITAAQCIRAQVEIRQYRGDEVMNTVALKDIDRWCFDKIIAPKPTEACVGEAPMDGSEFTLVDFSAN
ncbi:alpha/beta hydrolase [Aporhodopirellula aestuarii]|nr:alpha/beta fold hydrolase [Aporhodopirellula aestuarii]